MKFLFDFLPILLFFVVFKLYDIYLATAVAIAASTLQVAWLWLQHRNVEPMPLVTLALIVVLGGATLVLQDETFKRRCCEEEDLATISYDLREQYSDYVVHSQAPFLEQIYINIIGGY